MTTEAPFEALVLAAGAGRRFGGGKLLAPWRGGVLLEGALAAAFAAPVRQVTLVTGDGADAVAAAARAFAAAGPGDRLRIVHAADHAEGLGASLRTGAAAVSPDAAGLFVFLGDMPRIPHAVLKPLADAVRAGAPAAAPAFAGRLGHPALFGGAMRPRLQEITGDQGARRLLDGLGPRLAVVAAPDDGVLFDVDTPADLA